MAVQDLVVWTPTTLHMPSSKGLRLVQLSVLSNVSPTFALSSTSSVFSWHLKSEQCRCFHLLLSTQVTAVPLPHEAPFSFLSYLWLIINHLFYSCCTSHPSYEYRPKHPFYQLQSSTLHLHDCRTMQKKCWQCHCKSQKSVSGWVHYANLQAGWTCRPHSRWCEPLKAVDWGPGCVCIGRPF